MNWFKKIFSKNDLNVPGIYKMTNIETGDEYIGQSENVQRRINEHKYNLDNKKYGYTDADSHKNHKLAFDTRERGYSSKNFKFELLEKMPNSTQQDREKREREIISEIGPSYNIKDVNKDTQNLWSGYDEYNEWVKTNDISSINSNDSVTNTYIDWKQNGYECAETYHGIDQYKYNKLDIIKEYYINKLNDKISHYNNICDNINFDIEFYNKKIIDYTEKINKSDNPQEQREIDVKIEKFEEILHELNKKFNEAKNIVDNLKDKYDNIDTKYNDYIMALSDFKFGWQEYKNILINTNIQLKYKYDLTNNEFNN